MSEVQSTIDPTAFLSTTEAAKFLGIQPQTVVKYANAGKIRAAFFARRWKFLRSDLTEFAADNRRGKL
jgi:excisionase family DNA binding protein